jgi:hypothetical protein
MIKKDKTIQVIKVNPSDSNFKFNKGLYTLPKEAVNLTKYLNIGINPTPELIFTEGTPLPVNLKVGESQEFLESVVWANFLEQVASARSRIFDIFEEYLRHPSKLILIGFGILIVGAIVWGFIQGGIHI